jgi:hypothetical protein
MSFDLCAFPAMAPPPGEVSNFVDPPSLADTALGLAVFFTVWSVIFVAGRLYVNYRRLTIADCEFFFASCAVWLGSRTL